MRNPGFPVTFESGRDDVVRIALTTADRHPAKELVAEGVIGASLIDLGRVLADAAGGSPAPDVKISASSRNLIEVNLPGAIFSESWHLAAIFNLIDNSIFLGQEDDPLIIASTVRSAHFASASMEQLQDALGAAVEAARGELIAAGLNWPEEPGNWLIDIALDLSLDLRPEAKAELAARFELLNALLGETAFDPEADPLTWMEESLAPYPAAAEIGRQRMNLAIEMPPSDPALVLILFLRTLSARYGASATRWSIELREGW